MGTETALLFPSGWHANVGIIAALAGPDDAVFSDALNHASIIDGMRLARATRHVYPHGDVAALDQALSACTVPGQRFVVTESIFSMDGDAAPLEDLVTVAERHGAHVIIDDAHGLGVVGPAGRGLVAAQQLDDRVAIRVGTLGKAFGAAGAFVACSETMRLCLWNRARTFVFTTGVSPAVAGAIDAALPLVSDGVLQAALGERIGALSARLDRAGLLQAAPAGAIVPVVVGAADAAMALSRALEARGYLVTAIRPPTVPRGTSRLRITLRADLTFSEIDGFADALEESVAKVGIDRLETR
jgi:8-amino-7-oxononanoate synthase